MSKSRVAEILILNYLHLYLFDLKTIKMLLIKKNKKLFTL